MNIYDEAMHHALLDRRPHRPDTGQGFLGRLALTQGRVHEFCGAARHTLAAMVAHERAGRVLWVRQGWEGARVHGPGMVRFMDPGRMVFVDAARAQDILWVLEETLRSGSVPLVVGELPGPPGLTPMRRLQLACEAGGGRALGLILTPEGNTPGAESRWRMAPAHQATREGWVLHRERARQDPPGGWHVRVSDQGFALGPRLGGADPLDTG